MTHSRPRPYVGVSGVVTPAQQHQLETVASTIDLTPRRDLLLGVKATDKTQMLDIENKYGTTWYPVGEAFADALLAGRRTEGGSFRVAQVYLDTDHVHDPAYRAAFTDRLFARGSGWLDGVQFDMLPWHTNPAMLGFLQEIKDRHNTSILLQCHGPAMAAFGPTGTVRLLSQFAPMIDFVLFDSSHGTGTRLDVDALSAFVEEAYSASALDPVGVAVAGGLDASTVERDLPTLVERFPDLSWDAEGALHPVAADGTRPLDMTVVQEYLRASATLTR